MKPPIGPFLTLAFLVACSETHGPLTGLVVSTSGDHFEAGPDNQPQILVSATNTAQVPIHLTGCPHAPSVVYEIRRDGEWVESGSQGVRCIAIYRPKTVAVMPGETLQFVVSPLDIGKFRLRVVRGGPQPDDGVLSNEFWIE